MAGHAKSNVAVTHLESFANEFQGFALVQIQNDGREFADGIFVPPVESGGDRHLQRVREAAFGQFDFETILALRFGIAQGGFRSLSEGRLVCRLADHWQVSAWMTRPAPLISRRL